MTNQHDSHNRCFTSSGNSNIAEKTEWIPGMQMPQSGVYGLDFWAEMWKVDVKTITAWIKKYQIRYFGPHSSNCYIEAGEFLSCMSRGAENEAE